MKSSIKSIISWYDQQRQLFFQNSIVLLHFPCLKHLSTDQSRRIFHLRLIFLFRSNDSQIVLQPLSALHLSFTFPLCTFIFSIITKKSQPIVRISAFLFYICSMYFSINLKFPESLYPTYFPQSFCSSSGSVLSSLQIFSL